MWGRQRWAEYNIGCIDVAHDTEGLLGHVDPLFTHNVPTEEPAGKRVLQVILAQRLCLAVHNVAKAILRETKNYSRAAVNTQAAGREINAS